MEKKWLGLVGAGARDPQRRLLELVSMSVFPANHQLTSPRSVTLRTSSLEIISSTERSLKYQIRLHACPAPGGRGAPRGGRFEGPAGPENGAQHKNIINFTNHPFILCRVAPRCEEAPALCPEPVSAESLGRKRKRRR